VTERPPTIVFVYPRLGQAGGVNADIRNLERGLHRKGWIAKCVSSLRSARASLAQSDKPVLHLFGCLPSTTLPATLLLAKRRRVASVWTPVFHPIRPQTWRGYGVLRPMEIFDRVAPRLAPIPDAVIAATETERDFFVRLGAKRVDLIPPGVSLPAELHEDDEPCVFRAKTNLRPGPVVLIIGRDSSRKGLQFGLETFRHLRRLQPTAQLLLVGPDKTWTGCREEGVSCTGWLSAPDVEAAIGVADVVFVPSLYDCAPRVVLEAWRQSRPVVVSDRVGYAPEVNDRAGRVVSYGEAIGAAEALCQILIDPALRSKLGKEGQRIVGERYVIDELVDKTIALYEAVLEAGTSS
jgi:glycosyltransferase involved in cell wall biosynthesis